MVYAGGYELMGLYQLLGGQDLLLRDDLKHFGLEHVEMSD